MNLVRLLIMLLLSVNSAVLCCVLVSVSVLTIRVKPFRAPLLLFGGSMSRLTCRLGWVLRSVLIMCLVQSGVMPLLSMTKVLCLCSAVVRAVVLLSRFGLTVTWQGYALFMLIRRIELATCLFVVRWCRVIIVLLVVGLVRCRCC